MSLSKTPSMQNGDVTTIEHANDGKQELKNYVQRLSVSSGLEVDDAILRANGHKAVLQRQFKWISALGLGFSITNSWIGYLVRFSALTTPRILLTRCLE